MEGSGPAFPLPDQVPWLARSVLDHRLTWDQAVRVISLFVRLERRLYHVRKDEGRAQQFEPAEPDYLVKLSGLDQKQQDNLVASVLTGADQVL